MHTLILINAIQIQIRFRFTLRSPGDDSASVKKGRDRHLTFMMEEVSFERSAGRLLWLLGIKRTLKEILIKNLKRARAQPITHLAHANVFIHPSARSRRSLAALDPGEGVDGRRGGVQRDGAQTGHSPFYTTHYPGTASALTGTGSPAGNGARGLESCIIHYSTVASLHGRDPEEVRSHARERATLQSLTLPLPSPPEGPQRSLCDPAYLRALI
ncbi:hypothetical protein AAFF_G00412560 [Aldrovandia affinis]|uniref:Uncharacterized protein n=1 Tax=Aldrovandia affinis TaxID=143900 RepID=A0AAD7SBE8_9TELE|nr:hypothetical protein AAFF_G00412560 [Aldrovandia affinis]